MLNPDVYTLSPSGSQFDLSINGQYPYFDLLNVTQNRVSLGDYTTVDVGQAFNNNTLIESPQESTASNLDILTGETATSVGFDPSLNGTETTREGLQLNPVTPINKSRDLGMIKNQKTISDALWGASDNGRDYFFELDTPSSLSLNIGAIKENVNVELRYCINQNGNDQWISLRQGDNISGYPQNLNFFSLEPGPYEIRVSYGVSNKIPASTFYNLTVTPAASFIPPPDLIGNTPAQAKDLGTLTPVNSPVNLSETVWVGDTSDCYRFNLDKPGDIHVLLSGLNGDANIELIQDINSNGSVEPNEILHTSNAKLNQNENLDFLGLDAGTYYLRILPGHQDTWYNLSLSATPSISTGFNSNYGYGIANAAAAVAKATGLNIPFDVNTPVRNDNTWEQQILHVPEVWDQGITGKNIVVAVLDSGVDYNHLDLKDNIWTNSKEIPGNGIDLIGWDFVNNDNIPMDEYGHGTHVAGIIAAENNGWGITGVAYNAKIMPVRIGNSKPDTNNVINGIHYAVDNGANIINMSLVRFPDYPPLQDALQYAESKGVLCVIAAGNDNTQNEVNYPAAYADQWGIAVGAIDHNGIIPYFSNYAGSTPVNYVLAPGKNVDSTILNDRWGLMDGTSMAAPYVAGIAALILSANPNLTPDQLKKIILQTASPLPQTKIS
jgi:subtilisin family serine protease